MQNVIFSIQYSIFNIRYSFLVILACLFLPAVLFAQLDAGPDVTINPGVPVTLKASYGLLANEVTITDDGVKGPFPIGFDFTFYGEIYSRFYIGANGWISFNPLDINCNIRNAFLVPGQPTNTYMPKICILGPFQNFNPEASGGPYIFYRTIGEGTHKKLVVMWCQIPMNWCEEKVATFQIVLTGADSIENHIMVKPECLTEDANKGTLGIQNAYNVQGMPAPGRNATSWSVAAGSPEGWRYIRQNQDTYVVEPILNDKLEPITPGDKIEYRWYEGSSQDPFSTDSTVVVTPNETTTYKVTATICNGETFTDFVTVKVFPNVPTAFTPNDDKLNDTFDILGLPSENITKYNINIYNRWGQMVFSETDITKPWNGRMNNTGELCPGDAYVWAIYYEDANKKRVSNKGTVMLIR